MSEDTASGRRHAVRLPAAPWGGCAPALGRAAPRLARGDDATAVQACLEACADYFRRAEGRGVGPGDGEALLDEAAADPSRRVYLLQDGQGGEVAGLLDLALDHPAPGVVTVALLVVAPAFRRRGLGSGLVFDLSAELRRLGYRSIRMGVKTRAVEAAGFWQAAGAREMDAGGGVRQFEIAL